MKIWMVPFEAYQAGQYTYCCVFLFILLFIALTEMLCTPLPFNCPWKCGIKDSERFNLLKLRMGQGQEPGLGVQVSQVMALGNYREDSSLGPALDSSGQGLQKHQVQKMSGSRSGDRAVWVIRDDCQEGQWSSLDSSWLCIHSMWLKNFIEV